MLRVRRAGGCSGAAIGMPNSEGDFKFRGWNWSWSWSAGSVTVLVNAVLGIIVDDGILPGPASKSNVTSMLNLDGDGCSAPAPAVAAGFVRRFGGDAAAFVLVAFMEDDMYLSFDVEARGSILVLCVLFMRGRELSYY